MPQSVCVIQIEGILRKHIGEQPLESGRRLYLGLSQFFDIILVSSSVDKDRMDEWLTTEGFARHAHVVYGWMAPTADLASMLRNQYGYNVEYFVLTDPARAVGLIESGYSTLLVTNTAYALPEWRPDSHHGVRPWGALVDEIDQQRKLRANDKRMEEDLRS